MGTLERRSSWSRHADDTLADPDALQAIVSAVSIAVGDAENPKISLSRFGEGNVALFMPCGKERVDKRGNTLYVAFNVNCPRHFLHPSSLQDFLTQDPERAESYCLGRITVCYQSTADDEVELNLPSEAQGFHVCYAQPILKDEASE